MAKEGKKKKGNTRKSGAKAPKHKRYGDQMRRSRNKLRRILGASGPRETLRWATEGSCLNLLKGLAKTKPSAFKRAVETCPQFARVVRG